MRNTQKKNVPELRFPEFEGEWEEKELGEITTQSMYGIGASATSFDSKNIYVRITDIDEKSRKLNYQNLTTPDVINNKYKLKRNDLLFARTGASTGKSYIHKGEKDIYNYYFAGFLIKFEINEQNSPLFIYQFTLTSKFNNWVKVMSVRSGQPGINSEEYAKLPLVLPNKLEQQKIGQLFSKLDRQIELEEQKLELLQQQKKGYMQQIFSQELRFKDENGEDYPEWEEKQLGEFADKVIQKNTDKKYTETLTNSAELGIISQRDFFDKEISNIDNIKNYYVVEENDFVYNPRISTYAPFGPVNRNKLGKKGVMSPLYTVFRIQNIDLNFIEFYFKSSKWYRFMALNGDSGARADRFSIKDKTFMEMPLYIPCMDEQIKIGQFFNNIDKCIKSYKNKINLLKKNKNGFLQKMFI
ncbi:restriction endonuclease subunit S [Staphylococcus argenteus]|uniref:restriction endonuclease subunit S n=1 Tax=Staphylococcus argenteus TaxID=985002 RepID=UPI0009161612|nr:restriction endonuclease subunit S [Staphylococcus argenteus]MCG9853879.1 restriction endonuclease subunit S [Staphylococcus argenteus]MDR7649977.1 restriction endonuclease subunit S [Staphylococcus argenteus]MDR7682618.1 restriction endonuclease subunit S [Staphylococcus argenteus]SGX30718.1 type I restriction modification DNA specificity domain protein [Staphylococcus argenteus]SGX42778.1 type I restriction modification DNA specificity domain protein [Staphylococcus argenteus]